MPALGGGPDQRAVNAPRLGLGHRLFPHPRLDLAPFGVQLVQPRGKRCGLGGIVGRKTARAEVGLPRSVPRH